MADRTIAARYRLLRSIGSGGFGHVYEGEHVVTRRRCAVKLMTSHGGAGSAERARFMREAQLATQIRSPYVVDILDAGVDDDSDTPFIVMELLRGHDLTAVLDHWGTLSLDACLLCLQHVALALDAAHALNIVHRDLKPSNLFLARQDDGSALVKVLDFGIAKQLHEDADQLTTQPLGTPVYMAPEQFRMATVTAAVDVYALGMLAFCFVVGQNYFQRERETNPNDYALATILANGTPEPASQRAASYDAHCPNGFDAWFARATHIEPAQRFPSATEAVHELARIIDIDWHTLASSTDLSALSPDDTAEEVTDGGARARIGDTDTVIAANGEGVARARTDDTEPQQTPSADDEARNGLQMPEAGFTQASETATMAPQHDEGSSWPRLAVWGLLVAAGVVGLSLWPTAGVTDFVAPLAPRFQLPSENAFSAAAQTPLAPSSQPRHDHGAVDRAAPPGPSAVAQPMQSAPTRDDGTSTTRRPPAAPTARQSAAATAPVAAPRATTSGPPPDEPIGDLWTRE